jgi:outer membrane protein assembly factor BamB
VGISAWLNSPIVTQGLVVVGSGGTRRASGDDGDGVYALDLRTGRQRWRLQAANDVNGVATAGDLVVATGDEGELWGIDLKTGRLIWSFSAGGPVFTNPLIVEDRIVVGDASGILWVLDLNGREQWQARFDGPIRGGAASDGRMVYAVSDRGDVGAFTLDGFEMWRTRVELPPTDEEAAEGIAANPVTVFAAPTVADDLLVITFVFDGGPPGPALVGIDRYIGGVVWRGSDPERRIDSFASLRNSPARHGDDLVVASSLSYGVQGIEAASGRVDWVTEKGIFCERQWASPVVVGDLVMLPRPDGALHAYDATTGETVWRHAPEIPGEVATLATCTGGGQQVQDGLELQASVAVAPDGTLIVASTSQLIYAIGES